MTTMTATPSSLPITKAARLLGVHPNTLRAWADQGRVRCLRVNSRGDRRFLVEDLRTFMTTAENAPSAEVGPREAQIDSIAKLGTRLNHLSTVDEIGAAICVELRQLIDYHNVRVYRVEGEDVVPVAWRGEIGAYTGEDDAAAAAAGRRGHHRLGRRARHRPVPARRGTATHAARTCPAPRRTCPSRCWWPRWSTRARPSASSSWPSWALTASPPTTCATSGIYASIAAQAMANADITERLRAQEQTLDRQLRSQAELLRVTERILTTLDPAAVVAEIADSLAGLIPVDTLGIYVHERGRARARARCWPAVSAPTPSWTAACPIRVRSWRRY